ncbi:acidic mammalian chitinase-like [Oreochromis aureus]|uniref:chitinase n=1 Tax=Oreochromis aureus TaxID=47969 RepID=A0A668UV84_OREAU|nr:acidic mammalian chitinase-like [Oreochromis aureus]XP_039467925.1 acidic mammalian chitinase-like [Oreochromis aureus]
MGKLLIALGILFILHNVSSSKLVCHMTNWAQYRPSAGKFTPDNIDPFLCTHVIYTLATINSFNQISPVEWNDQQLYSSLNSLKNVNPALKTLLSVGGTVNGVSPFIAMVARPESRAAFISSVISFLHTHNFDGINLDWEYPGHNGSPVGDKEKFTLLVTELAKAFEDDAKDSGRSQLLLSASVAGIRQTIDRAYEVNKIVPHFDFINIMTYDFHGHWEAVTGHNSPLYSSSADPGSQIHYNINSSVFYWISLGAPSGKLLLGFPTYGRTYRLSSGATGLGAPANGPADPGPYTQTAGFWAFYEICDFINTASVGWISEQEVPYATYGSSWLGYDDKRSYSSKVQWMTANNLGGAHVWTLDMDDFSGSFCSAGAYPLINHLRTLMGFTPKPTTTPRPTTTRDPSADFCRGRPDGLYENPADKTTFFQCFQGNTYLHRCQPGLIYWDSCKCCNWP